MVCGCSRQLFGAFVAQRADPEDRSLPAQAIDDFLATLLRFVGQHQILLIQHQPALTIGQFRAEFLQFGHDCPGIVDRIAGTFQRRNIDDMPQQPGPLQMLEKLDAETGPIGCPLYEPRYIGNHETLLRTDIDDAEVRVQRREWIIGHLGSRRRDRANQRGLPRIRQTQQPDIGQHLHFEVQKA